MVLVVIVSLRRDTSLPSAGCFSSLALVPGGKGWESLDTERISVWERNRYSVSLHLHADFHVDPHVHLHVDLHAELPIETQESLHGKRFVFDAERRWEEQSRGRQTLAG